MSVGPSSRGGSLASDRWWTMSGCSRSWGTSWKPRSRGVAVADITGVRTTFEVSMDVGAMYERQQTVDPASLLALAGSLMGAGYGVVLGQELLAIRDTPLGDLAELQERGGQAVVPQ